MALKMQQHCGNLPPAQSRSNKPKSAGRKSCTAPATKMCDSAAANIINNGIGSSTDDKQIKHELSSRVSYNSEQRESKCSSLHVIYLSHLSFCLCCTYPSFSHFQFCEIPTVVV